MSLTSSPTSVPPTPAPGFPPGAQPAAPYRTGGPSNVDPGCCLVVDDSDLYRDRLAEAIRERGYRVLTADGYDAAVEQVRRQPPGLAVVDLKMPGRSGLDLVRTLREISPETKCVVVTGFGSIANAVDAIHAGALSYVTKPADADEILAALHRGEGEPVGPKEYNPPTLAENEWEYIQQVLADCGGNISQTARILGIERRTLQRKLKKMRP
ncbi:response regulator transcription factor [Alienimonas chondri]|uniref:Photosynthetic apparatus regulatory protein RegA n=1 Tax=Alienimonas chondri TaxID=2681879 RepID=A0ABX1VIC1_9PLAN|nr:response regulator [Alienimonas chondri]NNJ27835.1 Photosynthetic apparatus regulatory protein RegA [Alienimonas chondri]